MSNESSSFRLGKLPAEVDSRTLPIATIMRACSVPDEYDIDIMHPGIPIPMFKNDVLGDCVIAGRAHQTMRLEYQEQQKLIRISDDDVTTEYFRQTGGNDSGLITIRSLRHWQKRGWMVGDQCYKIELYASINIKSRDELRRAIYSDKGAGIGLALPNSASDQMEAGKIWEAVDGKPGKYCSWGGHYVYLVGYNKDGPICITWGQRQAMTWAFYERYCDEAYFVVDARNEKMARLFTMKAIDNYLEKIK